MTNTQEKQDTGSLTIREVEYVLEKKIEEYNNLDTLTDKVATVLAADDWVDKTLANINQLRHKLTTMRRLDIK